LLSRRVLTTPGIPTFSGFWAVKNDALVGEHTQQLVLKFVNFMPLAIRASMFGVFMSLAYWDERSPQPRSSVIIMSRFGVFVCWLANIFAGETARERPVVMRVLFKKSLLFIIVFQSLLRLFYDNSGLNVLQY